MTPRPPTAKVLAAELVGAVRDIYHSTDHDQLSVNFVRQRVESKLGLEDGFFKEGDWRNKSKNVIKDAVDELENSAPQSSQVPAPPAPETKPPKAAKRAPADEAGTPAKKRQRTKPPVTKKVESDLSELSDSGDDASDESEKPTKKKLVTRAKQARKVVDSDSDTGSASEASEVEAKPKNAKPLPKKAAPKPVLRKQDIVASDTDSALSEAKDVDEEDDAEPVEGGNESSESEVIDEPPKRKRKPKESPAAKGRAKPRGGGAKPAAEVSADEAEIKRLQGQLVKCGVRKIWPFELKQYGDDCRAKIRHLKSMLKDVGMDGRFSESRAKEIKERRELLADLEAVTEMDNYWGAGGGRSSRSRAAKSTKLPAKLSSESDDDDNDDDNDDEDGENGNHGTGTGTEDDDDDDDGDDMAKARARGSAKYRADMAFLGDESESD